LLQDKGLFNDTLGLSVHCTWIEVALQLLFFHAAASMQQQNCGNLQAMFLTQSDVSCRVWLPYLNPIFWTVYGLIESQVDNLDALVTLTNQQQVPVYEAVEMLFGYQ